MRVRLWRSESTVCVGCVKHRNFSYMNKSYEDRTWAPMSEPDLTLPTPTLRTRTGFYALNIRLCNDQRLHRMLVRCHSEVFRMHPATYRGSKADDTVTHETTLHQYNLCSCCIMNATPQPPFCGFIVPKRARKRATSCNFCRYVIGLNLLI